MTGTLIGADPGEAEGAGSPLKMQKLLSALVLHADKYILAGPLSKGQTHFLRVCVCTPTLFLKVWP